MTLTMTVVVAGLAIRDIYPNFHELFRISKFSNVKIYSELRKNKFQAIKDGQYVSDMRDGSLFNSCSV